MAVEYNLDEHTTTPKSSTAPFVVDHIPSSTFGLLHSNTSYSHKAPKPTLPILPCLASPLLQWAFYRMRFLISLLQSYRHRTLCQLFLLHIKMHFIQYNRKIYGYEYYFSSYMKQIKLQHSNGEFSSYKQGPGKILTYKQFFWGMS